jgi:hypothetical protein
MGHEAGIVEDDVNPSMRGDRRVDQALDLFAIGDIGLDYGSSRLTNFLRQNLKPIEATCAEDELCSFGRKMTRGRFAKAAAGAGDDDDFTGDVATHLLASILFERRWPSRPGPGRVAIR